MKKILFGLFLVLGLGNFAMAMKSTYIDWDDPQGLLKSLNIAKAAQAGIKSPEERRKAPLPQQTGDILLATDPQAWNAQQDKLYNDIVNQPIIPTPGQTSDQANEKTRAEARKLIGDKANNLNDNQLVALRQHFTDIDTNLKTSDFDFITKISLTQIEDLELAMVNRLAKIDPNIIEIIDDGLQRDLIGIFIDESCKHYKRLQSKP